VPAAPDRRPLNVFLSQEAFDGLREFADAQHVTVSALIEAIGRVLSTVDETRIPPLLRRAVQEAREIDIERRRRPRG
jgi:hypothetical protein